MKEETNKRKRQVKQEQKLELEKRMAADSIRLDRKIITQTINKILQPLEEKSKIMQSYYVTFINISLFILCWWIWGVAYALMGLFGLLALCGWADSIITKPAEQRALESYSENFPPHSTERRYADEILSYMKNPKHAAHDLRKLLNIEKVAKWKLDMMKLIAAQSKKGATVAFKNEHTTILVDQSKNIIQYEKRWSLFKGHYVDEHLIRYENLDKIKVKIYPTNFNSVYMEYTLAGLLVGGAAGVILGSLIDSIRGVKTENISLDFEFQEKGWGGHIIYYNAFFELKVRMTENSLKPVVNKLNVLIETLKTLFPDKVKF